MKGCYAIIFLLCGSLFSINAYAQGWQWARGTTGAEMGAWLVATDPSGNVFTGGYNGDAVSGLTIPALFGTDSIPFSVAAAGGYQSIIAKYDASGNFLWGKGTQNGDTYPLGIATDKKGNSFLFGALNSASMQIGTVTLTNASYRSYAQYFLAKFDPSGNVLWARSAGCTNGSAFSGYPNINVNINGAIATDTAGNVYITTGFQVPTITIGTYTLTNADPGGTSDDILLAKYDSSGNVLWATSAGGGGWDDPYGLTLTPAGDIYITGVFESPTVLFGPSTLTSAGLTLGQGNVFIARYSSAGVPLWACSSGGAGNECAQGIASDAAGNVYVTGTFEDNSIAFTGTTITNPYPTNQVLFLVKFDPFNNLSWYKTIGSPVISSNNNVNGYSVAVSPCNDVWVSGSFDAAVNIDGHILNTPPLNPLSQPAFIVNYSSAGMYAGSSALQQGDGAGAGNIACDMSGNVYVCGSYDDTSFTIGSDTLADQWVADSTNGQTFYWQYLAKYNAAKDTTFLRRDTATCPGVSIVLTAPAGYSGYLWNNGSAGTSVNVNNTGTFWVVGYGSSCADATVIDTFTVTQKNVGIAFSLGPDTTTCDSVILSVPLTGVSYLWQNGSTDSSYTATLPGTYYVKVDKDGCTVSDTINIHTYNVSQHLSDTILCKETFSFYTLYANVPAGGTALWNTGSTQSSITVKDTGNYSVTVTDAGCVGIGSMQLAAQLCHCEAMLPTAFSPNDDGKNDYYHPLFEPGCHVTGYAFSIYNRWGQRIFYSEDPYAKWDGTFGGAMADIGVYMYYLQYTSGLNSTPYTAKGDITLVR